MRDSEGAADCTLRSPLGQALAIWGQGRNISLALAAKLMAEGYDVKALELRFNIH